MNGDTKVSELDLKHYGVLGMKWGVRKNPTKAYVKASKKNRRLVNRGERLAKMVGEATKDVEKAREKEKKLTDSARVSRAGLELAAKDLETKTKRYENSRVDPFGTKASAVGKATKRYNEAVKEHNERATEANKAILDRAASEELLGYWVRKAQKAIDKSNRWSAAMETAFKDVSPDAIAAGKAILEKKKRK